MTDTETLCFLLGVVMRFVAGRYVHVGQTPSCDGLGDQGEPTITPEDTLRDAGIDDERQAEYQRRMSVLLTQTRG